MRPLVSSSVLYVDLLFSTSTTTTTPSSAGISSETRTSCDRPTACVTEAILSTTTERIAISSPHELRSGLTSFEEERRTNCGAGAPIKKLLFAFSLFASPAVEHTGQRDDLRETQGVRGRPLAGRFTVH